MLYSCIAMCKHSSRSTEIIDNLCNTGHRMQLQIHKPIWLGNHYNIQPPPVAQHCIPGCCYHNSYSNAYTYGQFDLCTLQRVFAHSSAENNVLFPYLSCLYHILQNSLCQYSKGQYILYAIIHTCQG